MQTARPVRVPSTTHRSCLSKQVAHAKAKKHSVTVASVFKPRPRGATKAHGALKFVASDARAILEEAGARKPRDVKSRPSSRSPQKGGEKPPMHPFELEFNETTNAYRTHVYAAANSKLNTIHTSLLKELHTSLLKELHTFTSQANPSDASPSSPNSSPKKLAVIRQIESVTENICTHPGEYRILSRHTKDDGEQVSLETTLGERISNYGAHLEREEKALKRLQAEWELIVGEIWKLGVQTLGEGFMSQFLTTVPTLPSPSPMKTDDELPSVGKKLQKVKKSVTFQEPTPKFMTGPSQLKKPVLLVPDFPTEEVSVLQGKIGELGTKEVAKLKKVDKEFSQWWGRKSAQIMALQND